MPASDGDWYLKLCPDDVGASALHAVLGHAEHQHHHHAAEEAEYQQCDLGLGAGADALIAGLFVEADAVFVRDGLIAPKNPVTPNASVRHPYHPRAPPLRGAWLHLDNANYSGPVL